MMQPRSAGVWSAQEAEDWLLGLEQFGMRFGLDRMRRLMAALGAPHERFRAVHVVGTNGKSSTTRMTAAMPLATGTLVLVLGVVLTTQALAAARLA